MHPSGDEAGSDSDHSGEANAEDHRRGFPALPRPLTSEAVLAAWNEDHHVLVPSWEQGHGATPEDLLTWDT
eukprot:442618-Heterocapsa_arctica.AAC.1